MTTTAPLDKIGPRLSNEDDAIFNAATGNDKSEQHYDEVTGMEYERVGDILAMAHDAVGLVTYYRVTDEQWDDILSR